MLFKKKAVNDAATVDLDKEGGGGARQLQGRQATIIAAIALTVSLFAIYTNSFMNIQEIYRNTIFLAFVFVLGFLLNPATKNGNKSKFTVMDTVFALISLAGMLYIIFNY